MSRIYLDHISTTPPWPEVLEAMRPFLEEEWASPSSLHCGGLRARAAIREAREKVTPFGIRGCEILGANRI